MSFLRNVLINVNSAINQRRWLRMEVGRLRVSGGAHVTAVVRALDGVLHDEFAPEELERIHEIESMRRRLLITFSRLEASSEAAGSGITIARAALSSKSAFWARVLFKLIRVLGPGTCLELGTNMGVSAAYQASALKVNGAGSLRTLEGEEPRARLARRHLAQLGLDNVEVVLGRFQDTLPAVLRDCGSIDFAFIDGHHDELATRAYFDLIASRCSRSSVIVLDDVSWSDGMKRAWAAIRRDPRVRMSVDLRVVGLCAME